MKITIDLDATPDEARRVLGAPDIAPMQEVLVEDMTAKRRDDLRFMNPEQMWWHGCQSQGPATVVLAHTYLAVCMPWARFGSRPCALP
jgi:hypothetical protein